MGCPSPTPCPLVHTPPRPHRPTSPLNTATLESTSPSNSSRKDTYGSISSGLLTLRNNQSKQLTNWDQETVKRHKRLPAKNPASNWEQKKCSGKFVLLTLLVFTLSLWVQLPTLLFDDDVFLSFFGTCLWLWTQSPVFLVLRDYPMRLCSAAPTVPPTSELMGNVSPLLNTPTEQEKKKRKKNLWHHTLLDRMTPDSAPNLPRLFFTQLQSSLCNKCVLFRPPIMPQKRIIINIVFFLFIISVND